MYAVIKTGGKQYRVEVGTELQVELLEAEPGTTITLDHVLMVGDGDSSSIGRPLVADAAVSAEVVRRMRGEKLISFKYRPKARSRVKKGHRQELTVLRIADITIGAKSAARDAAKAEHDAKTERQRLEEVASVQAAKDAALAAKLAVGTEAAEKKPTEAKTSVAAKAPSKAKTKAAEAPSKAKTKAAEAPSKAKAAATETSAKAKAKAAAVATETKPAKRTAKAAGSDVTDASTETKPAKADAPKRPRATKKDE